MRRPEEPRDAFLFELRQRDEWQFLPAMRGESRGTRRHSHFLGWLFLMWKAYQGENFILPVVGPIAQQQAGRSLVR